MKNGLVKRKCFNCWSDFWGFDESQCYCQDHRKEVKTMPDEETKNEDSEVSEVETAEDEDGEKEALQETPAV